MTTRAPIQQFNTALARCTSTVAPPAENDTGELHSDFANGNNLIESAAKPARNLGARRVFLRQMVASPKADQCAASVLRSTFLQLAPAGSKFDDVRATVSGQLTNGSDVLTTTFRIRGRLSAQGQQQAIDLDDDEHRR